MLRHLLHGHLHQSYVKLVALGLMVVGLAGWVGQSAANAGQEKKKHPLRTVISGTVFTEKGFSLPGASIRVNRVGERKARWEAMSDRQGEFGLWVPQGAEYEVHVKAKGYEEETQKVDGKSGLHERLVFHMNPAKGEKKP
jgi:hypothetical protein